MSEVKFIKGVQLALEQSLSSNNTETVRLSLIRVKKSIDTSLSSETTTRKGSIAERLKNSLSVLFDPGPILDNDVLKYADEVVKYLAASVARSHNEDEQEFMLLGPGVRQVSIDMKSPGASELFNDGVSQEDFYKLGHNVQWEVANLLEVGGDEGKATTKFQVFEKQNAYNFHLSSNPEYQSDIDSVNSETASVCSATEDENDIETNMTSNLLQLFGKADVVPAVELSVKWDRPSRHGLANSAPIVPDMFRDLTLRSFIFLVNQRLDELRTVIAVKAKGRNSRRGRRSSEQTYDPDRGTHIRNILTSIINYIKNLQHTLFGSSMDDVDDEDDELGLPQLVSILSGLIADVDTLDDGQILETMSTINRFLTDLEAELPWDAEDISSPMSKNLEEILGRSANSKKDNILFIKIGGYHGIGTGTLGMDWQAPAAPGLDNCAPMVTYVDESPSLMSSYVSRNPSWKGSVDLSNKYEDFENAALSELAVFDHFTDSDIFPIIDSHSDRSSWNSKDGAYPYPLHVSNHNILDDGETSYEFVGKKFRDNSLTYD